MLHVILKFAITLSLATTLTNVGWVTDTDLPRRASWGAGFERVAGASLRITSLNEDSGLAAAGLAVGDIIVSVDGRAVAANEAWSDITSALTADTRYRIAYRRGDASATAVARFSPLPKESYDGLDVSYSHIVSDHGVRQRVIITRPKGVEAPQPAIFVLQGLSCSSIEYTPGRRSNFIRTLRGIVERSGMVVMRTEKPGLGDSEGDCSTTDFKTELNGYEAALQKLKNLPYVDPERILIYGSSMGSALAPYFANKYALNAVISDGTWYRTWFEHMLEIERRIKQMQGVDEATINNLINRAYIPLYYGMLIEKKSYAQVIAEQPLLAEHNYHGAAHMYGRPVAFYHQLQDFDIAGNWARLKAPVRIRWGTSDWIMSEYDNDILMDVLTTAGHTDAELYKYPGLDHFDTIQPSAQTSFSGEPGRYDERIFSQVVEWAKVLNGQKNNTPDR